MNKRMNFPRQVWIWFVLTVVNGSKVLHSFSIFLKEEGFHSGRHLSMAENCFFFSFRG